jgi:S1-C subfamily serine protease
MTTRRSPFRLSLAAGAAALIAAAGAFAVVRRGGGDSPSSSGATLLAADAPTAGVVVIDTRVSGGEAAGTGMVLTSDGEVLTNNHVIRGATSIRVTVPSSGRTYTASVVGYSVTADTAVLRLKGASGLTTVRTAPGASLAVGQTVRAVGNAGGTGSLTTGTGTVTGLDRQITASDDEGGAEQLTGLIETDAGLRPGDSGGPLLDSSGRVVGMDTAASTNGRFAFEDAGSDGYAIPIGTALKLAAQITAGTSSATVHVGATAFLGVQLQSADQGYGGGDGFGDGSGASGAIVANVVSGSAAEKAGLHSGDDLTAVDGTSIASVDQVGSVIGRHRPGDRVAVTYTDGDGSQHTTTVTLGSGPPR